MDLVSEKFAKLGCDNAPGQEINQKEETLPLIGDKLEGRRVDFSHGDVDAHPPIPGSLEAFNEGFAEGGVQAYTEYKGRKAIRDDLAAKLAAFTGAPVDPANLIVTPGTQCALFLAMGATVGRGDKVAIVEPDYFANRKLVEFFDGELVPIYMDFEKGEKVYGRSFSWDITTLPAQNANGPLVLEEVSLSRQCRFTIAVPRSDETPKLTLQEISDRLRLRCGPGLTGEIGPLSVRPLLSARDRDSDGWGRKKRKARPRALTTMWPR